MDGFGGVPTFMRDDGPDGMPRRGDHGPPMMHHSLPGDMPTHLWAASWILQAAACSTDIPNSLTQTSFRTETSNMVMWS